MSVFQYQDYRNPYGPSIAEALAHQADPQAAAALRTGDIEAQALERQSALRGQLFTQLGAIPGEIQASQDAAQQRAARQQQLQIGAQQLQVGALSLEDKQRQRDAEAAVAQAVAQVPLLSDGTYDIPGISKAVDPRHGPALIPVLQRLDTVNTAITGHAQQQQTQQEGAASRLIAAGSAPLSVDNFLVTLGKAGRIPPDVLASQRQTLHDDPSQAERLLRQYAGIQKGEAVPEGTTIIDPLTRQPLFTNAKPDKPDFEKVTDVTGPNNEALSYDKKSGTYRLVSDPSVIVKVPTIAKKPPTGEEDKARYLGIQTAAALGQPVPQADQAWAAAYAKEKTLTTDTSASAAANRQAAATTAATAQQQRAQDFAQLQAARSDIRENVDKPYATAKSGADTLRDVVTAAQGGNLTAAALQNLETTMAAVKAQGLNRINTAEVGATGNAGSMWDRLSGYAGQKLAGKPVPANIQKDMLDFADILEKAAAKKAKTSHDATNTLYGAKIPYTYDYGSVLAPPTGAASAGAAPQEGTAGVVNGVPAVWKTINGKAGWYKQ